MAALEVMLRALDFIEAHLRDPIGVAEMAESVSYSLYHFCRTFRETVRFTPYDYLMRRRVAEAARALLHGDFRVIDVAFDYQFSNPETFSRAFKRVMGVPPSRWRDRDAASISPLMPRLTPAHLRHWQHAELRQPTLVKRPALTLVGVMTVPGTPPDAAWDWLRHELNASSGDFYALTYATPHGEASMVALAAPASMSDGRALCVKTLPALRYARFAHCGPAADFGLTLDYVAHAWLPQSDCCRVLPLYLEHYGDTPGRPTTGKWSVDVPVECPGGFA